MTIAATQGPGRRGGRSWGIVVIIIQMRRAKLELCPSPSGWLTVTNSSLIHPNHQLYTGQRRPERQEEAECIPTAARRLSPSHWRPPSVCVRQEAACHHARSRGCSAQTSVLYLAVRLRLDPTRHDVMTGECRPENKLSFPLRARCIHFNSRSDVSIYIPRCNLISRKKQSEQSEPELTDSRRESR